MEPVLCLDVGGTHTRVGIYEDDRQTFYEKVDSRGLFDENYAALARLIDGKRLGGRAVVAFPSLIPPEDGPVSDKGLNFDRHAFAARFSLERVDLLNDLEAGAYHIERDLEDLFGPGPTERKSIPLTSEEETRSVRGGGALIVYAGTGLGTSAIVRGHVVPSEINRFLWAPVEYDEQAFAQWLVDRNRFPDSDPRLAYDVVCSGFAIPAYYAFRTGEERSAAEISERAAYDTEARETFMFFFRQLGRYTAFCAQAFLTYEGIVLGGNILRSNLDLLVESRFLDEYRRHCYRHRLRSVPIALDLEHDINLRGCADYARRYP